MKARMLLDGGNPKVSAAELKRVIEESGIEVSERGADLGIVVGGDGKFSRYGRTEKVPLLFVGVRSNDATGSRAFLAQTTFDELPEVLTGVASGEYDIEENRRLAVLKNGKSLGEVFTDVYLQRGSESTCLRYKVRVTGEDCDIDEAAIGDGIIISTSAGSTGYYSYPDRIKGDRMDPTASTKIGRNEVGICHVTPTYTERVGMRSHPLRYIVPWGCRIELTLSREADARLYGTTDERGGIRIATGDKVVVLPGKSITRLVLLKAK